MASIKIVFIVLFVVLCIECNSLSEDEQTSKINKIIDGFKNEVKRGLDEIIKTAAQYNGQLDREINVKDKELKTAIDDINSAIGDIKKKAEEAGKDVTKCVENCKDGFAKVIENAKAGYIKCYDISKPKFLKAIEDIKPTLPNVEAIGKELMDSFNSCNNLFCKETVIGSAIIKSTTVTMLTTTVRYEAEAKCVDIFNKGVTCLLDVSNKASTEVIEISSPIVECMNKN